MALRERPTVRGAQQHREPNSGRLRVAVARGDHGRRPPRLGGRGEAARRDDPPGRHGARGLGPLRGDPRPARRAVAGRRTRAAARRPAGLQRLALGGALDARHGAAATSTAVIGYELENVTVGDETYSVLRSSGKRNAGLVAARARRHRSALGAVRRRHGFARHSRARVAGRRQGAARAGRSRLRRGRREPRRTDRRPERRRTVPLSARREGDGGSRRDRRRQRRAPRGRHRSSAAATPQRALVRHRRLRLRSGLGQRVSRRTFGRRSARTEP